MLHKFVTEPLQIPTYLTDHTHCLSWPNKESIVVRCWCVSGQLINCCGHGLSTTAQLWLKEDCNQQYESSITLHAKGGYLILEWPNGFNLRSLPVPSRQLENVTKSAMIVTCLLHESRQEDKLSTIQYRYFAPQYGVQEDIATGSAMRILADYWQLRKSIHVLDAYQYSPAGGLLHSTTTDKTVVISGDIEWM